MKNFIYLLVFTVAVLFSSCNNDESIKNEPETFDPTSTEVAFPDKARVEAIEIDGEVIQVTQDNDYILQSDIILTAEQIADMKEVVTRGAILNNGFYLWSKGKVYYTIASGTTTNTRNMISEAIKHWENITKITFVPRRVINLAEAITNPRNAKYNSDDYVEFFNGEGCWSHLGKIGGKQRLSIDDREAVTGNVIHEIGHVIGLLHEHSRNDQDNYIIVNYDNIKPTARHNYDKSTASHNIIRTFIKPTDDGMDYGSVMMYDSYSWSNAIYTYMPVMTKKDGSTWSAQRTGLSISDIATVATIYGHKPGVIVQ